MKIKRWGFYGKDRKTAMYEWKKIKKSNVSLRQLSESQKAVYGGVPGVVGLFDSCEKGRPAAIIITREAER